MDGLVKPERWLKSLLLIALLLAVGVLLVTLLGSIRFLRPGPGFDYWDSAMPFLKSAVDGPWQWSRLWEMYGGAYCLVLPRLIYLAEWFVTDFRNDFMLAFGWVSILGIIAIVMRAVWQEKHFDQLSRYLCLIIAILASASGQHMNNLSYAYQSPAHSTVVYVLLFIQGIYCASLTTVAATRRRSLLLSVGSAILLTLTIFSLPSLLVTWCALALGLRLRLRTGLLVASIILLATLAYASQMQPVSLFHHKFTLDFNPQHPGDITIWMLLAGVALFVLQYIGAPVADYSLLLDTVFAVICVCGWSFFVWKKTVNTREQQSLLVWLILGYGVYLLSLALCTALGRVGSDAMTLPRYRSYVMPFLLFTGIVAVYALQQCKAWPRTVGSAVLLIMAFLVILPGHNRLLKQFSKEYDDYVTPFVPMSLGITHSDVVHQAHWGIWWAADNKQMLEYRDFLRDHRKGIYAEPYFRQVGQSLVMPTNSLANNAPASVIEPLPGGGYQWKSTTDTCDADGRIALVNAQGVIVGAGLVSRALADDNWRVNYEVLLPLCRKYHPVSWIGFLPVNTRSGDAFTAVAFHGGKPVILTRAVMP